MLPVCEIFLFFFVTGLGFLWLGNMPFDSQSSGILPRFYLLPLIPAALAAGWLAAGISGTFAVSADVLNDASSRVAYSVGHQVRTREVP